MGEKKPAKTNCNNNGMECTSLAVALPVFMLYRGICEKHKSGTGKGEPIFKVKKSNNAIEVIVPNHNYEKIGLCCFCCIATDRCSPFPTWDSAEAKNENIPRAPTVGVDPPPTSGVSTGNTESRTQGTPNVKLDLKARRGNDTALMPEAPKQEHPIPSGFPSVSIPVPILR